MKRRRERAAVLATAFCWSLTTCVRTTESKTQAVTAELRRAQLLLRVRDEPTVMRRIQGADEAIEAAIRVLVSSPAPRIQGDRSGVAAGMKRPERFRRSMALLISARHRIAGTEQAAVRHIDDAIDALRDASSALGIGLTDTEYQ